jgi:HEAT repeat protein
MRQGAHRFRASRLVVGLWAWACLSTFAFPGDVHSGVAAPTHEDLALAEEILRRDATLSILSGLGSALGGPTMAIDFETAEPYVRTRLLRAVRRGGLGGGPEYLDIAYAVYDEMVAMPATPVGLPYFEAAAQSDQPLLRSIGLSKLARADKAKAKTYVEMALSDSHEVVRCEGIAALTLLTRAEAAARLKPVSQWRTALERCEAASALVRLGDLSELAELERGMRELQDDEGSPRRPEWDYAEWVVQREAYYSLVLASAGGHPRWAEMGSSEAGRELASALESFVTLLPVVGDRSKWLRPLLASAVAHANAQVRGQAVRCLGRMPEQWSSDLLKTRLQDDAVCSLNSGGYGWHATVACLAAICLLERGDQTGLEVLRGWVSQHRALIEEGRTYEETMDSWEANERADLRDTAAAVALARAGDMEVADVLRYCVREWSSRPPESWDSSPVWLAYHLARLGDSVGMDAIRRQLVMVTASTYRTEEHNREAAAALVALARDAGKPLLYAPARGIGGPVFYPDCWCE